jgi:hypothetical protein
MNTNELNNVTRVEIIDAKGRSYVKHNISKFEFSIQDNGKTLKLFLTEEQPKSNQFSFDCV